MKVCYIDESGNQSAKDSRIFVMVGIVADAQRMRRTKVEFSGLFEEVATPSVPRITISRSWRMPASRSDCHFTAGWAVELEAKQDRPFGGQREVRARRVEPNNLTTPA